MFTSLWTSHGVVLRTLCLKPTRINFQIHERFFRMLFNQKHPLQISARVSGFPKKHLEKSTLLEAPLAVESSHKALILWEKPIPLAVKKALAFFGNGFSCMKKLAGKHLAPWASYAIIQRFIFVYMLTHLFGKLLEIQSFKCQISLIQFGRVAMPPRIMDASWHFH